MQTLRWTLGPEPDRFNALIEALGALNFRVTSDWTYPGAGRPFNVTFSNGTVELLAECETQEGVVVSGPEEMIRRLRAEYERLSRS
jgi:hypothetical protein